MGGITNATPNHQYYCEEPRHRAKRIGNDGEPLVHKVASVVSNRPTGQKLFGSLLTEVH